MSQLSSTRKAVGVPLQGKNGRFVQTAPMQTMENACITYYGLANLCHERHPAAELAQPPTKTAK